MNAPTGISASLYGRRALEHARNLAKPRRTGSEGEREARRYLSRELRSLGYKVSEESFSFEPGEEWRWRFYYVGIAALAALLVTASFLEMRLATALLGLGILVFGLGARNLFRHQMLRSMHGKSAESANLFVTPPGAPCFGPRILLIAHYDSKSQTLSLRSRIACVTGATILGLAVGIVGIVSLWWSAMTPWVLAALAGGLSAFLVPLFLCCIHDRSPGATDNAAAVGVLLEVAERLRLTGTPHGREICFLFSGAEEEGVVGAMKFLQEHTGALHEREHQVINLDILGSDPKLFLWSGGKNSRSVEEMLAKASAREKIPLGRIPLVLGAAADHIPFASAGVPAVTITSPFGLLGKVHTARDSWHLLREDSLGYAVRLLETAVRIL